MAEQLVDCSFINRRDVVVRRIADMFFEWMER